jgi:plastocyanin
MRRALLIGALPIALALTACAPTPADHAPGAIGMEELVFDTEHHVIPVGGRLTFSNTGSRALHVLVPGKNAQPRSQRGIPSFGGTSGHRAEVGDTWTTPPWTTPGTYWVTCTLHPQMNLEVVVNSADR